MKRGTWCAGNSSSLAGKSPPREQTDDAGEDEGGGRSIREITSKETELGKESERHKTSRENTKGLLIRGGRRNNVQQIAESIGN